MGNLEILHDVLVAGSDFESCRQRVEHFFDRTTLIRYDEALIIKTDSVNGSQAGFWRRIQEGLKNNQEVLEKLLAHLKGEGFTTLDDLLSLEKGYQSKVLHTIAHLKDGFVGIDSRFFNLEEDSHGITGHLKQKIAATPDSYWLLRVCGRIASMGDDPLDDLRTFERQGENPG